MSCFITKSPTLIVWDVIDKQQNFWVLIDILMITFKFQIFYSNIDKLSIKSPLRFCALPKWQNILNLPTTIQMCMLLVTVSWLDSVDWTKTRIAAWTYPCAEVPRLRIAWQSATTDTATRRTRWNLLIFKQSLENWRLFLNHSWIKY